MLQLLVILIPTIPLLAALLLACWMLSGRPIREKDERATALVCLGSLWGSAVLVAVTSAAALLGQLESHFIMCRWLQSGDFLANISFMPDAVSLPFCALISLYSLLVAKYAVNYLHREAGYARFQIVLLIFVSSMQWIALSGNAVMMFAGWEIAGLCSFLLIAYNHQRMHSVMNATYVFTTNRLGSCGWLIAIFIIYAWGGGHNEWPEFITTAIGFPAPNRVILTASLLVAAYAKSAQLPFSSWISRAMDGPTPSSALFYGVLIIHAGVFLLLRLRPLLEAQPEVMMVITIFGGLTAVYAYTCGLTQTDVKSSIVFASLTQTGLMFMACGLGLWAWVPCHMLLHGVLRGYQFLLAPSFMTRIQDNALRTAVPSFLASNTRLYNVAMQRFWLEMFTEKLLLKPVAAFARDLQRFDALIIDRIVGMPIPSLMKLSRLAELEEQHLAVRAHGNNGMPQISGVPGAILRFLAGMMHWFELNLVLHGMGVRVWIFARRIGRGLGYVETLLLSPRYLLLIIIATLVAAD